MKKFRLITILLIGILLFTGCSNKDAIKFKEDYEGINGKEIGENKYREVSIDKDNPFVEVDAEKIIEMIENDETFYVYFGDKKCPWCRSVIEKAIKVSKEYDVDKIYYVSIWDDDFNEILRDKYKLDDKGKVEKVSDGTDTYNKLLKEFDSLLSDYTLTDNNKKEVKVGEKRIYAPNFIYVNNGKAVKMTEGISDKQKDAFEELSDEILDDEEKLFKEFFNNSTQCSKDGC